MSNLFEYRSELSIVTSVLSLELHSSLTYAAKRLYLLSLSGAGKPQLVAVVVVAYVTLVTAVTRGSW